MCDFDVLARWESRGKANWVEVHQDRETGFCGYSSNSASGSLGTAGIDGVHVVRKPDGLCWVAPDMRTAEGVLAVEQCARKVATGFFLPDAAKTPMKRVL